MMKNKMSVSISDVIVFIMVLVTCTGQCFLVKYNMFLCYLVAALAVLKIFVFKGHINLDYVNGLLILITFFIGATMIVSSDRSQTSAYLRLFTCLLLLCVCDLSFQSLQNFLKACEWMSVFVGISIVIESVFPTLVTEVFWVIASPTRDAGVLNTLSRAIAKGYYSGFACEKSAAAYIMNIGLACKGAKYYTGQRFKARDMVGVIVLCAGLLLTGKRMLFAIPVAIFAMMELIGKKRNRSLNRLLSVLLIGAVAYIVIQMIPQLAVTFNRFTMYEDDTLRGRDFLWAYAFTIFRQHPLIGCGFGAYNKLASSLGLTSGDGLIWTTNAHNIYIQILAETGIIGSVLFALLFGYSFVSLLRLYKHCLRKETNYTADVQLLLFSIFIQGLTLLYGLTGNPIYTVNDLFLYGFSLIVLIKVRRNFLMVGGAVH